MNFCDSSPQIKSLSFDVPSLSEENDFPQIRTNRMRKDRQVYLDDNLPRPPKEVA